MTIKETIEKSIEGGWKKDLTRNVLSDYFLDPDFWQSLGKTMGWTNFSCSDCYSNKGFSRSECLCCLGERERVEMQTWEVQWHRFIDHLAEGKSIEDYFKTL